MSFFPAYVPQGTLLYHGHGTPNRVTGIEWLAFEIQHAEMFAVNVTLRKRGEYLGKPFTADDGYFWDLRNEPPVHVLGLAGQDPHQDPLELELRPGYLHIYQTTRPLKLLYLDGMSAAKCDFGPMDTQDILLLNFTLNKFADRQRARQLCELAQDWGVEGFIRMECGFELIKCNFSEGLDFISHKQRPERDEPGAYNTMFLLDFVREIGNRYDGIDGGRVELDYSSMVSAFFYPTNLSNPEQDPSQSILPRLVESDKEVLERIKSDLGDALRRSKRHIGFDWQGVADMIVKRFAARLEFMVTNPLQEMVLSQVNIMLNLFIDYGASEAQDPVMACALHYLKPILPSTEQDRLIEAAFKTVTHRICSTLFEVRRLLFAKEKGEGTEELEDTGSAVDLIRGLNKWLDWSDWKVCGQCGLDEVCFIAVFPFGTAEDHYSPHCVNNTEISSRIGHKESNYWKPRNIYGA